jgi:hypothetical protein
MAGALEEAGGKGDMDFIDTELTAFCESLSGLVGRIRSALAKYARGSENEANTGEPDPRYRETLSRLRDALTAENVGEADALLEELEAMPIGPKAKETLSAAAGLVLTSEFEDAAGMVGGLI